LSHSLSYLWQASCAGVVSGGTFSPSASSATPTWTAPVNPLDGPLTCLVSVNVVDGHDLSVSESYSQVVSPGPHTLQITGGPGGAPNPVESDGAVTLDLTASDSLLHELSYQWEATCAGLPDNGQFSSTANDPLPVWLAPTNYTNATQTCTIKVTVSDGLGKTASNQFTVTVNPAPVPITIRATDWVGNALDPDIPPSANSNLQFPNYAVVLYRADQTEMHATDAFSLSDLGTGWELTANFAAGDPAVLRIFRNASQPAPPAQPFSAFWGLNSGSAPAWRTYAGKTLVGEMSITIQANATYHVRAFLDLDSDGMDDTWEADHGVSDPTGDEEQPMCGPDPCGDGLNNLQEFQHGTDPFDRDSDDDGVEDGPEANNGDDPADSTDWIPTALRATVGNQTVYLSWNGVLNVDPYPDGAKLNVDDGVNTALIDLDPKADHYRLTTAPGGGPLVNGVTYQLSLVLKRGTVTRNALPSEVLSVKPSAAAFTPDHQTLFLHGFGGRADETGSFAETLNFVSTTLGWTFGGRFCLPNVLTSLTTAIDNDFSNASVHAADGSADCSGLGGSPNRLGTHFTVDFGNSFATYPSGVDDGLARQAAEIDAVLDTLFPTGTVVPAMAGPVTIVAQGTAGEAARRYLVDHPINPRVARLISLGSPHQGADTNYWCGTVGDAGVTALGGIFTQLRGNLETSGGCTTPASVGGVRDVQYTCVNGAPQLNAFLDDLHQSTMPAGVSLASVVSFWEASDANAKVLPNGGARSLDCESTSWNGLVPTSSATAPEASAKYLTGERFTESEGNDIANVLCSMNAKCLVIELTSSAAEMSVTLDGLTVSRQVSEIPGAAFITRSTNDGSVDTVILPLTSGGDSVTVAVSQKGTATGTYTLQSSLGGGARTSHANHQTVPVGPPNVHPVSVPN
jgi:hypothetical protein